MICPHVVEVFLAGPRRIVLGWQVLLISANRKVEGNRTPELVKYTGPGNRPGPDSDFEVPVPIKRQKVIETIRFKK